MFHFFKYFDSFDIKNGNFTGLHQICPTHCYKHNVSPSPMLKGSAGGRGQGGVQESAHRHPQGESHKVKEYGERDHTPELVLIINENKVPILVRKFLLDSISIATVFLTLQNLCARRESRKRLG